MDLNQLVCNGKTLRGSIDPKAGGGSAFGLQPTTSTLPRLRFIPRSLAWQSARAAMPHKGTTRGLCSESFSVSGSRGRSVWCRCAAYQATAFEYLQEEGANSLLTVNGNDETLHC